jgi:hypothetical protein
MASDADSYEKPMAHGLKRMLAKLGVTAKIFWKGHAVLEEFHRGVDLTGRGLRHLYHNLVKLPAMAELAAYDAIIVISTIPDAYMCRRHGFIEILRRVFPAKPIVLYDCLYLPTRGSAYRRIKEQDPRNFGMERYDYYLAASVVSEFPMPSGDQPVSVIGVNLEDPSLRVDVKRDFVALLDFERPSCMKERAVMIQALEDTRTPYVVLNGHYPMAEIRAIYRGVSVYFPAHRESFGLPICEVQLCGALVFTPYADWVPSHWIKPDLTAKGPGALPDNFIVYGNDAALLRQRLVERRAGYDPARVAAEFQRHYSQYWSGDLDALRDFVRRIETGAISGRSHSAYSGINERIVEKIS